MSFYIGIDFGTCTNFITKWDERSSEVKPIENLGQYGAASNLFPNAIYYESVAKFYIGEQAVSRGIIDACNSVEGVKRWLSDDNWTVKIPNLHKEVSAEEIVRDIFSEIRRKIQENFGGASIDGAVISVPYSFQHKERLKIRNAAEKAGLNVIELIEEPIAAAICYAKHNWKTQEVKNEKILIFDLGGGTFDVTIISIAIVNDVIALEVLNTDGHKNLGGRDIDEILKLKILQKLGYSLSDIPDTKARASEHDKLLRAAKDLKEKLSEVEHYEVLESGLFGTKFFEWSVKVEVFNSWLIGTGFISKIRYVLEDALNEIDLVPDDIDKIILVGGASNIPIIKKEVSNIFGKEPLQIRKPEELVGEGAGLYCGYKLNREMKFSIVQKVSHSIGVKAAGKFAPLILRNSRYEHFSEVIIFPMADRGTGKSSIEIFQGNSTDISKCILIGSIEVHTASFPEQKVGIQLGTDHNGIVIYKLYDIDGRVVEQCELK